jgi:hypothetical protein
MRSFTFAELSTDESSAVELAPPFLCIQQPSQAKPRNPEAFPVPTLSRRRAFYGSPAVLSPSAADPAELDPRQYWRNPISKFCSGFLHRLKAWRFCDEHSAQELTLQSPRLPHHRHAMTVDEALAGIVLVLVTLTAAFYVGWRFLGHG